MKIVACIKAVKSELVYPNEIRSESFLINPYDLYALENCMSLKKQISCEIICICMGPEASEEILIKCLAMGADQVILLKDRQFSGSDTVATTYILSKAIEKIGDVALVVCGQKTIDGETGQVTYGLAERLRYNCIANVRQVIDMSDQSVILSQEKGANITTMNVKLPVSISFNQFILRQPNIGLLALKNAKKRGIKTWTSSDIEVDLGLCGIRGSKTQVLDIKSGFPKKETELVEGTQQDKAMLILSLLSKNTGVSSINKI